MEAFISFLLSIIGYSSVTTQQPSIIPSIQTQLNTNIQNNNNISQSQLFINNNIVNSMWPISLVFSQYRDKLYQTELQVNQLVSESKIVLEKNIQETKKNFQLWVKNDWEEFRKTNWWLGKFFIEDLDNKKIKEIEKILENQKQIIKDYLENKKTLFEVYEIAWMLEKYIKVELMEEYRNYMNDKIDILKTQKYNIHQIKTSIKTTTIDIKRSIEKNSEEKDIILEKLKIIIYELPEDKRESFIIEFINQISKNETALTKAIAYDLTELLSSENSEEECINWLSCSEE